MCLCTACRRLIAIPVVSTELRPDDVTKIIHAKRYLCLRDRVDRMPRAIYSRKEEVMNESMLD